MSEVQNGSRLGQNQQRSVEMPDLQGHRETETPSGRVELVHAVHNPQPPSKTPVLPPVPRSASVQEVVSPEIGRVKRAFERFPSLEKIAENASKLVGVFDADTLVKIAPKAARNIPLNKTANETSAWLFKFVVDNAA